MGLPIYKPGQGYWTRVLSAVGAGTLVLAGAAWIYAISPGFLPDANQLYYQAGLAVAIIVGFGMLIYFLLNKPNVVDFMIAVEAEMKKVNWPSKKEIVGSTWVVICGTFMFAGLLFLINFAFGWFFLQIGILAPTGN
ncbi:preprotein translocase subunit SecE [Algisphaera agarilytica]|uniref:Protein translocase subunit SecE n=1 Tax=Algisphaera agarilytica TaxID=1385975 RepID=A0A7X0LL41_9BACT|nr:preprotein translocase subunit SecE [Algisphaera agarilytica]MBB6430246.1 preprotein translocase subunit SecE [Algisphaera agarilytica]